MADFALAEWAKLRETILQENSRCVGTAVWSATNMTVQGMGFRGDARALESRFEFESSIRQALKGLW